MIPKRRVWIGFLFVLLCCPPGAAGAITTTVNGENIDWSVSAIPDSEIYFNTCKEVSGPRYVECYYVAPFISPLQNIAVSARVVPTCWGDVSNYLQIYDMGDGSYLEGRGADGVVKLDAGFLFYPTKYVAPYGLYDAVWIDFGQMSLYYLECTPNIANLTIKLYLHNRDPYSPQMLPWSLGGPMKNPWIEHSGRRCKPGWHGGGGPGG